MAQVFEEGEAPFKEAYSRPQLNIATAVVDVSVAGRVESSVLLAAPAEDVEPVREQPAPPSMLVTTPTGRSSTYDHNPRSAIIDCNDPSVLRKHLPTMSQVLIERMQPRVAPIDTDMSLEDSFWKLAATFDKSSRSWYSLLASFYSQDEVWIQYVSHLMSHHPSTLTRPMWVSLTTRPIVHASKFANELGACVKHVLALARSLGYLVIGHPSFALITTAPISGLAPEARDQQAAQMLENDLNLAQARVDLRAATVEKAPQLQQRVKVLKDVTERAEHPMATPAYAPTLAQLPRFERVPNLNIAARDMQSIRAYVSRILTHNHHQVSHRVIAHKPVKREFSMDGRVVLVLSNYDNKEAWNYFENMIVNKYVKDNPAVLESSTSWADAEEEAYSGLVRLYRTARGPIFIQKPGEPVILAGEHSRLSVHDTEDGPIVYMDTAAGKIPVTLRKGTAYQAVARLANLLGEEVTVDQNEIPNFVKLFPHLHASFKKLRNGPKKKYGKIKQPYSYTQAPAPPQPKAKKAKSPSPQGGSHKHRSYTRSPDVGERLPRHRPTKNQRQAWVAKSDNKSKSPSVGRHQSVAGGRTLATVAPRSTDHRVHHRGE